MADLGGRPMDRNVFNFMRFSENFINVLGRRPQGLTPSPRRSSGSAPALGMELGKELWINCKFVILFGVNFKRGATDMGPKMVLTHGQT